MANLDPHLTYPIFANVFFFLPEHWREKLRFGVKPIHDHCFKVDETTETSSPEVNGLATITRSASVLRVGYDNKGVDISDEFSTL